MWEQNLHSQLKRLLQLRFDLDSTRQSGHHDSRPMLMKAYFIPYDILLRECVKGLYQGQQSKDATRCRSVSVNAILITVSNRSRIAVESQLQ